MSRVVRNSLARIGSESTLLIALLLSGTGVATASMNPIVGDPVQTVSGAVAGTRLESGVRAYLGIPYAKPPVLGLRWQAPQPIQWKGTWNADRMGPECIQVLRRHDINHYFGEEASGEDCLYLNVWAPAGAAAGAKLPVIVFIYGGAGTIGSAGMAHYDGEQVARHGAIFVSMNYRVGLLGFMAHPELSKEQGGHSGNYGYLDQNAALRWVHDNIAAFGGDPAQVVLAGQSFGAGSVAAQIMSPLSRNLFRAAMMSSGCNFTREPGSLADGEKTGIVVQKRLGATSLAELRNMPADRILALQAESQNLTHNAGVAIPRITDGYFLTAGTARALESHGGSAVPVIANFNGDDNDALPERYPLTTARTVAQYRDLAQQMFGKDANTFLKLYPAKTDADVWTMARKAATENEDSGFLASARTCAVLQSKYNGQPTYIDQFVRKHPYTAGVSIADQDTQTVGAYHNADIPYWFGTIDSFNLIRRTRDWTPQDYALSNRMLKALIAFARTGSPETGDVHWPAWTAARPQFLLFGAMGDSASTATMDIKRMDWVSSHRPAPVALAASTTLRAHD